MDTLIKNVTIIHEDSPYHLQKKDIYIVNNVIVQIGNLIGINSDEIIEGESLYCCIGLCDIGTHSGEPGFENRETIETLTLAALAGGYTDLVIFPNTNPILQSKSDLQYITNHPKSHGVHLHPIGILSKDNKNADIAEYFDMQQGGAIAFSAGNISIKDSGLLSRALQYASVTKLPIIHHPDDEHLSTGGEMHEGVMSTIMGLRGIPSIAEVHTVHRDILLLEYNDSILIEHGISAAGSVDAIQQGKTKVSKLFCTVPYLNLIFSDEILADYDTNVKVIPPLRSKKDKDRLTQGITNGTIDVIVSNHTPLDQESKNVEFQYAVAGASGLETCFPACLHYLSEKIDLSLLVYKFTIAPRKILGLPIPSIKEGEKANMCIFSLEEEWTYSENIKKSKSSNNPFVGKTFTAKVIKTIV